MIQLLKQNKNRMWKHNSNKYGLKVFLVAPFKRITGFKTGDGITRV